MKYFSCFSIAVLWAFCAFCAVKPVMHYDLNRIENGKIFNLANRKFPAQISGRHRILGKGVLALDHASTSIVLPGTEKIFAAKGITLTLLYKRLDDPAQSEVNRAHDAFFFKKGEFVFGRKRNMIYTNFIGRKKRWSGLLHSRDVFIPNDKEFHHVAMTMEHRKNVELGEDQTVVRVYFDGVLAGSGFYRNDSPDFSSEPIELASGRKFGPPWRIAGEIADPHIYDRVLSAAEIRNLVRRQSLAKPGFRIPKPLSAAEMKLLDHVKDKPGYFHSLKNMAQDAECFFNWRKATAAPDKFFRTLKGDSTILTLLEYPGHTRIVSWYDLKVGRELLSWGNRFFSLTFNDGGKEKIFTPVGRNISAGLLPGAKFDGAVKRFAIQYRGTGWECRVDYSFAGDRLEYRISDVKGKGKLVRINAPEVLFEPMKKGSDVLLVPMESGRAIKDASRSNTIYSGTYPSCNATMQMGAVYDDAGGVFVSSADPAARIQDFTFAADDSEVSFSFSRTWKPGGKDEGTATLALFRGNWYDAGVLYRQVLERMDAHWWKRSPVGTPCPEWLKRNALWCYYAYGNENNHIYRQLRDYFGVPFALSVEGWFERGAKYSSTVRLHPDFIDDVRELQSYGLRVQTYNNGRIVQKYDFRGKETDFTEKFLPAVVRQRGVAVSEHYPDTYKESYVLCPQTGAYQQLIFDIGTRMTANGLDGVYFDQIGCTTPKLCDAGNHGHQVMDPDAWYANGHVPALRRLREYWKEKGMEKWISTESNAETCVRYCDMMSPWRWCFDDQVPLYPLVYAGRTQFGMRDRGNEETAAAFVKDAEQILSGEQIGRLNNRTLASPLRGDYRAYVKRLIYLRLALLDYFEKGMMARPPEFVRDWKLIPLRWSVFGSKVLSRPPVLSAAWQLDDKVAVILVNTTDKVQKNRVKLSPYRGIGWVRYTSNKGVRENISPDIHGTFAFELPPYSCMVLTTGAGKNWDDSFKVIGKTGKEHDPFAFDPGKMKNVPLLQRQRSYRALDAAYIAGANRSHAGNQLNYIYFALVCPGEVDFGKTPAVPVAELMLSAPAESTDGVVKVYIDSVCEKNMVASFNADSSFRTPTWMHFKPAVMKFNRPVSGRRKLIFCFYGGSMCNFRSWKIR